ncbi:cytochrome P450 oxidoreductase GliF [Xylaria bambusicola]|uniref:cytochrome P450 oxidoreductase GliF n=1 Tax=Xylaria bambusicola TaxID=326684 RepID=UPI002008DE45|nr:cytochrome P450 oxidoreductase GliF [Xylaria bambusicola]KAI0516797.1 cytochrome P450 oxidoreductase GliF [Xylaria bambusicola]
MLSFIQEKIIEPYLVIRQSVAPLKLSRWQLTKLMARMFVEELPEGFTYFLLAGLVMTFAVAYVLIWNKTVKRVPVPTGLAVVKRNDMHFLDIIKEGRELYPGEPFLATNKRHSYVIFPPSLFDEIKRLPEHTASARSFFHTTNYGHWSHIGTETPELIKSVIADLTRSLPARVVARQEDCQNAFEDVIGRKRDWKEFPLMMTTFEIVTQINACSFVGRELGTSKGWIKSVMWSPIFIHVAVTLLDALPLVLRPLLAPIYFFPTLKNRWDMKRLLTPELKKDIKNFYTADDKKEHLKPKPEGKIPFTGFLLQRYKSAEANIKQLISDYILISFDSTPSTASALFHALCELALHPEAAEILRQELDEVVVAGNLPGTHLQELRKMDSFLRESFRMHPISLFALQRCLEKPVKFSVGPTLPAGTIMAVDGLAINRSPELWPNPDEFDMFRFYNLRQKSGNENKYHFLSTGNDSPGWGDGTQACPGRFFATSTLKIALAHFLKNYDIEIRKDCLPLTTTPLSNGSWKPDDQAIARIRARC